MSPCALGCTDPRFIPTHRVVHFSEAELTSFAWGSNTNFSSATSVCRSSQAPAGSLAGTKPHRERGPSVFHGSLRGNPSLHDDGFTCSLGFRANS